MKGDLQTILSHCEEDGDCLVWKLGTTNDGYPQATVDRQGGVLLRRWVYKHFHGRITHRARIVMTCGNQLCLNVEHMAKHSYSQVLRTCYQEGVRSQAGMYASMLKSAQERGMTKLTMEKALALRERMRAGERIVDLMAETGLSESALGRLKAGESWKEQMPGASVFNWRPQ